MTEGMIKPTFSIIVPIYNVERFLNQCITSILTQSYREFEVILVDDGSPDNCPQICDDYSRKDNRVVVIHKENGGLVSARKAGLKSSSGRYIINVDGDDYIHKDLLKNLWDKIEEFDKPDIISFSFMNVSFEGKEETVVSSKATFGYYCNGSLRSLDTKLLYDTSENGFNSGCLTYSIWSKAIKREVIYDFQMKVDETITNGEDVAVVIPTILASQSLYVLDFIGYFYRGNPNSIVHSFKRSELESYKKVLAILEQVTIEERNIIAYGYRVFQAHLIKGARASKKPLKFVDYCKEVYNEPWIKIVMSFTQPNLNLRNKIGVFVIKKKMWLILWLMYSVIRK